jgi:molybdopterin-guanine dinucleotide biosynthesis protein A
VVNDRPDKALLTGVILAGGRGSRMGGVDKGLQHFDGGPLALHAMRRLSTQTGTVAINANRNLDIYRGWGAPVWSDSAELEDFAGPLAGFLTALEHCQTPYLLTVPCDTPLFPPDLVARMVDGLVQKAADIAMVSAPAEDGRMRVQPVFCLMHIRVLPSLREFTLNGGRKIRAWADQCPCTLVAFDRPDDSPLAFFNANTLSDLQQLETLQAAIATTKPSP